jgi:DNA polymerase I
MKLLIDADYIVYKCCASSETEVDFGEDLIVVTSNFSDVMRNINRELDKIKKEFFDSTLILFFSHHDNFRKKLYPDYKGHRNRKKPCGYKRAIKALELQYEIIIMDTLEADDALGIYATKNPGNVLVSPDKDMRQIPGKLYDLKNDVITITPESGHQWHYIQTLAGDQTDGYAGVPGYGVKTATKLFEEKGYYWDTIVDAFKSKGLTHDDALLNARLAKILQERDYDFINKRFVAWCPTAADYRSNNGAGVPVKED